MNSMTHPDTDSLLSFLEQPEDGDFSQLSLHLATCTQCRNELTELSNLSQKLVEYKLADSSPAIQNRPLDKLQRLLSEDTISEQQRVEIETEIADDKDMLRAALHFAGHNEAMKKDLPGPESLSVIHAKNIKQAHMASTGKIRPNFLSRYLEYFQWRPPLWSAVTMTALLLLSVSYNLQEFSPGQQSVNIIAYQENPVITFTSQMDNNPGIGFFSDIQSSSEPFKHIKINLQDKQKVTITWPKVDNAGSYTLRLHQLSQGDRQLVAEQQVADNNAAFSMPSLQYMHENTRFEWTLSGITTDNKEFRASGGFAITGPPSVSE